ncbi:alpha/beta fold hydrolase [Amycolatopsis aidingensis]|uniref:alpha/beta fold hydrolase n=1 Tax=Amycolatopsis aidingensis TaxID=2842453 RepID=UPI001C0ABAB4|nr:alpha/beta hydrolase [Amycolatopsis aidingensis]
MLLLHGMGGGPGSWDALAALLAPHLELWDVSLPWAVAGDPDWALEPDVRGCVAAPIEAVRRVNGRGPDVLVAHSFAANVMLELLTGPDSPASTATVLLSPFYRERPEDFPWSAVVPGLERCYGRVADEIRRRCGSRLDDVADGVIARRMLELVGGKAPLRFHETCRRTPFLDLDSLDVPLLLVGGEDDEFGAHAEGVRALGRRVPHAWLEILEGCGHFPMVERAREVATLMNTFIGKVTRTSDNTARKAERL